MLFTFSALKLLVAGHQEKHLACKEIK